MLQNFWLDTPWLKKKKNLNKKQNHNYFLRIFLLFACIFVIVFGVFYFFFQKQHFVKVPIRWTIQLFSFQTWTTAKKLLNEEGCSAVGNAFYFDYDTERNFIPAWILVQDGVYISPWKEKFSTDPNLQNTIFFDTEQGNFQFFFDQQLQSVSDFKNWQIGFYSGPWIIKNGKVNEQLQQNISHWSYPTQRTLLAQKWNQTFLLFYKERSSLWAIAETLQSYYDNVINLDGGPSTSFILKNGESFNENKILPFFFCVK